MRIACAPPQGVGATTTLCPRAFSPSTVAAAMTVIPAASPAAVGSDAIRPFQPSIPEEALIDLRRRVLATRWPDRETVTDSSQGVRLATVQALARYWATDYDWRMCEARLKALPHFTTEIDGLDIHFIHVRSKHEDALPVGVEVMSLAALDLLQ